MDDSADAKKILTAFSPEDWKRPPGHPWIKWMKTVLNDLERHNLTLSEAVNMCLRIARCGGCWLWVRLCSLSGAGQKWWWWWNN